MRVAVALVPPRSAQLALARAVAGVSGAPGGLELVEPAALIARLVSFGYLTLADVNRLANPLRASIAEMPPLSLSFGCVTVSESRGAEGVRAVLDGDVDELETAVRVMGDVVRRLGFLVDRRGQRAYVQVGRVTSSVSAEAVTWLNNRLSSLEGMQWVTTELSLVSMHPTANEGLRYEVVESLPLSGTVVARERPSVMS